MDEPGSSYTGEVLIRAYGGQWVIDERVGAYGAHTLGVTGFPFSTALRVLTGEEGKSLASMGRSLPHITARGGRRSREHSQQPRPNGTSARSPLGKSHLRFIHAVQPGVARRRRTR